ncbi:hypothetical protein [Sneathiella limimaris]|uniref:hypothetical protein n=1 Tax=Sneathiella limimaris TaxID=1964213 RepID=UPI001469FF6C|nr:hypothetical protein [Sneathiella limimaris]
MKLKSFKTIIVAASVSFLSSVAIANAATVSSLVGDIDGFGGATAPGAVGVDTGFGFDNRSGDPLFTDVWLYEQDGGVASSPVDYSHAYDLAGGTATSATLSIMESGMANNRGPWNILFNGTLIGSISNTSATLSTLHTFSVALDLLTGTSDEISLVYLDTAAEGYAIDYSLLEIEVSAVPLPAALPLYGAGMAILGFLGWRKKRNATA